MRTMTELCLASAERWIADAAEEGDEERWGVRWVDMLGRDASRRSPDQRPRPTTIPWFDSRSSQLAVLEMLLPL